MRTEFLSIVASTVTAVMMIQVSDASVQGNRKRVFCNFDGCYSKRDGGRSDADISKLVDPVELLLRRLNDVAKRSRSDDVLAQKSAVNLETEPDTSVDDERRDRWIDACCTDAELANIRR